MIELGGNDALRGTPPQTIKQNLLGLVREAKLSGAWVILFAPPVLPNYGKTYALAVTKVFDEVSRAEKITQVPCFICGVATQPGMMQSDGIHPNESAQALMLDAVWPYLKQKLHCKK